MAMIWIMDSLAFTAQKRLVYPMDATHVCPPGIGMAVWVVRML